MSAPQINRYLSGSVPGAMPFQSGYQGLPIVTQTNGYNFTFRKRHERIDWKRLASIDVDALARNMDFLALQDNVMNLTFCNIESELDSRTIDPNYIKLFKLCQLTIEYLLNSQEYLLGKMQELQAELNKEKEEHSRTQTEVVDKLKAELSDMKKELQQRKKFIALQQQIIQSGSDSYNKCAYCSKAFINGTFLRAHVTRRHPEAAVEVAAVAQSAMMAPLPQPLNRDQDWARELNEIREKLQQTELQLIEEKNNRNNLIKKDPSENAWMESELHKEMEAWKQDQLAQHTAEIEKVQTMFMKEIKDLNDKLNVSETALEDLRQTRNRAPMLGSLHDDVDPEEVQRQRQEIQRLMHQLDSVEASMQSKLLEQEKQWKKKLDQASKTHNNQMLKMNLAMDQRINELERKKSLENSQRSTELENRQRQEITKAATEAVRSAMSDRVADRKAPKHVEEPIDEPPARVIKLKHPSAAAARPPVVQQIEDDSEEDEESEGEPEEELEEEATYEGYDEPVRGVEGDRNTPPGMTLTLSGPDRLKAALERDPDYLRNFREDVECELEDALQQLGISGTAQGLEDRLYTRIVDTLKTERNQTAKKYKRFYDIRNQCMNDVENAAKKQLKQKMLKSGSLHSTDHNLIKTTSPISNRITKAYLPPHSPHDTKPRSVPQSPREAKPQKVALSHTAPQPVKRIHQTQVPKPAPRTNSPRARTEYAHPSYGTSSRPAQGGADMLGTGSMSFAGNSTMTESQWDSDDDGIDVTDGKVDQRQNAAKRQPSPQPRPRVVNDNAKLKTTADVHSHSQNKPDDDDDDDDDADWDEISELPVAAVKSSVTASQPVPAKSVRSKAKLIEQQLQGRQIKKPFGGVDVTPGAASQSPAVAKGSSGDIDNVSLTSVSSNYLDDEEHVQVKEGLVSGIAKSTAASTGHMASSGNSWDESTRATSTVNSRPQKMANNEDDHWDSPENSDA